MDLFYTWQLIDDKGAQLAGLIIKIIIFLGIGTLPYIDNFARKPLLLLLLLLLLLPSMPLTDMN